MTIPKPGSRQLAIDGRNYRWALRYEGSSALRAIVLVDDLTTPRGTLHIHLPELPCEDWLARPAYVVLPRDLARWITQAIASGWVAKRRRRSELHLKLVESDLEVQRIVHAH